MEEVNEADAGLWSKRSLPGTSPHRLFVWFHLGGHLHHTTQDYTSYEQFVIICTADLSDS